SPVARPPPQAASPVAASTRAATAPAAAPIVAPAPPAAVPAAPTSVPDPFSAAAAAFPAPSSPLSPAPTPGPGPTDRPSSSTGRASRPDRGRVKGDELITLLFEAMHDLHFLRDAIEGGDFCLSLALETIPSAAGLVHLYDIDKREFVVACING